MTKIYKLAGEELNQARKMMELARVTASISTCFRSRCGSIVTLNDKIVGTGYNSPPKNQRLEFCVKDFVPVMFKSDRTCCIHAEQRAIRKAVINTKGELEGAILYFTRIDEQGNIQPAGLPYCTICSKEALDTGISLFILQHHDGIYAYETEEYNDMSFSTMQLSKF